ncbi:MAG: sigma-70 family RNA polymerase sigma factor [Planctomycetales bacterium]
MHFDYKSSILKQLRDQQVRFAPRDKKIDQATRAEKLISEIDVNRDYPYEYLCFRVTDFRPESNPDLKVSGKDALHDLRLFVEDVSDAADVEADAVGQDVWTVEDLSRMFNVSTKTISRWREKGLISWRLLFDGRKRVGFLQSSVDQFVSQNRDRVQRGSRFSQLDPEEKEEIVSRARRLARAGGCPAEVTKRLAKRMNRSVETIRYTLKQFDEEHPDLAIFPNKSGPLTEARKKEICQQFRQNVPVDELAKQFCRTRTSIYRIVNEMRAKEIMELPLEFIDSDEFPRRNAADRILGAFPPAAEKQRKSRLPSGLPPYLASLYDTPLLTREQEAYLFRKMNFLKRRASRSRDQLNPARPRRALMDQIEADYKESQVVKNQVIRSNLRLVVSIAKRHVGPADSFFELVSDGNISLMRAVEKFVYSRGNKFSTYATWAIMKNFARSIPDEHKQRTRFRTSHDEMFDATVDTRTDLFELESAQNRRESDVGLILDRLDDREQRIIISRFGLDHRQEPQTLKEVGRQEGVTKERVRQIEARALNKLRKAAQDERIDA